MPSVRESSFQSGAAAKARRRGPPDCCRRRQAGHGAGGWQAPESKTAGRPPVPVDPHGWQSQSTDGRRWVRGPRIRRTGPDSHAGRLQCRPGRREMCPAAVLVGRSPASWSRPAPQFTTETVQRPDAAELGTVGPLAIPLGRKIFDQIVVPAAEVAGGPVYACRDALVEGRQWGRGVWRLADVHFPRTRAARDGREPRIASRMHRPVQADVETVDSTSVAALNGHGLEKVLVNGFAECRRLLRRRLSIGLLACARGRRNILPLRLRLTCLAGLQDESRRVSESAAVRSTGVFAHSARRDCSENQPCASPACFPSSPRWRACASPLARRPSRIPGNMRPPIPAKAGSGRTPRHARPGRPARPASERMALPAAGSKPLWNTPDIWLRGEYVLPKEQDVAKLSLEVCHDEDFEVYINGTLAAQAKGHITAYKIYPLAPDARQALKPGKNLIAVHCHQTAGGQFIDVGFTTKTAPYRAPDQQLEIASEELRPEVAAKYVKRDTWQETLLAVRAAFQAADIKVDLALGSALAVELWRDFPHQTDWLMQDSPGQMSDWVAGYRDGKGDLTNFLKTGRDASLERRLIEHVLPECGSRSSEFRAALDALVAGQVPPEDRRWLDLYVQACRVRRQARLRPLLGQDAASAVRQAPQHGRRVLRLHRIHQLARQQVRRALPARSGQRGLRRRRIRHRHHADPDRHRRRHSRPGTLLRCPAAAVRLATRRAGPILQDLRAGSGHGREPADHRRRHVRRQLRPLLSARRQHPVRFQPGRAVGRLCRAGREQLLHLRPRRRARPPRRFRPGPHALAHGARRRPRRLHAVGLQRPLADLSARPAADEPRRHRSDRVLRQQQVGADHAVPSLRHPRNQQGHGGPGRTS